MIVFNMDGTLYDERDCYRGLTGLAQINGRGELTKEAKLAFDVEYVQKASLAMDFKIIFITFFQVFAGKSIYEKKYSQNEQTRGQRD